jgi:Glycosyltransferase family 92
MGPIGHFRAAARQVIRAPAGLFLRIRERAIIRHWQHELAVCAIFREEAPFLSEWLAFHRAVGVTHFYLYNNESTDNFESVLDPWCKSGLVTLKDWPGKRRQLAAYEDCLETARANCEWVAFIDVDEFLFSPRMLDIRPILRKYRDLPGLFVWQAFFGSGGHTRRPTTPVTLTYRQRAPLTRRTVKTIANPRFVYKVGIHEFKFWGAEARDTARRSIMANGSPVFDLLRINHYWSRSLEDLNTKIARGAAHTNAERIPSWHYAFEQSLNMETDEAILPIARAVPEIAAAA